jgi:hypothetical protein
MESPPARQVSEIPARFGKSVCHNLVALPSSTRYAM